MSRKIALGCVVLALAPLLASGADKPLAPARLSAAAIVERNIAARGGLGAWRAVQTLAWSGALDAGGNNQRPLKVPGVPAQPAAPANAAPVQLPFVLQMKRPRMQRLEIQFNGQTAVQVYDGKQGWKVRPFLSRSDVELFTSDELEMAAMQADLDGALVDYAAKGTKVEVDGIEQVEGRDAYRLKLTFRNNHVVHDWVDAQTFLELKIEGTPRRLDGKLHAVAIYLRDYRAEHGLQIPHVLETSVQGIARTEKIRIEKVVVNPPIDQARFTKPS
jgi:hypothetical protein